MRAASTIAALLRRDMEFGNLTRINALGSIVNALVTIAFAWFGFGFMSFAWGTLASALVRMVLGFTCPADLLDVQSSTERLARVLRFRWLQRRFDSSRQDI